ncbi:MAG: hypothetical protein OXL34_07390 [Gemmatimonadota bacterium]|nr:hypothetical protein [Gemmatimonadota bacterium]
MKLAPIHPFPARMAPELARDALEVVPEGGSVLDPMCGSGTVPRAGVEAGFECVGVDMDPLAVTMSQVWTSPLEADGITADAQVLVRRARSLLPGAIRRPVDPETQQFIGYWFGDKQEEELARLTTVMRRCKLPTKQALMVALSRIIVSKEMMASLARDTSHSRPHKVAEKNDFDVYAGFQRSAGLVAKRLRPERIVGKAAIGLGDARTLHGIGNDEFDLVLTSPPYLNAIDYIRGHRLSLVWMGHVMASLRKTRASCVGAERIMSEAANSFDISPFVTEAGGSSIGSRHLGWIRRYASDMEAVLQQVHRTVKPTGYVVLVLGNSFMRGTRVNNAGLIEALATKRGFRVEDRKTREIPARRRYLPPPGDGTNALDTRMRIETVLTLRPGVNDG